MSQFEAFTIDEFWDLTYWVYRMDDEAKERITAFIRDKCASAPGMMQLLIVIAEMCAATLRQLEPDSVGGFAVLRLNPNATPAATAVGRILTATVNRDEAMQVALIRALLERAQMKDDGREVPKVAVDFFGLYSFLLNQLAGRNVAGVAE